MARNYSQSMSKDHQTREVSVTAVRKSTAATVTDTIAIEEPLEIRLGYGSLDDRKENPLAITMRTPGHDRELAAGFLFSEGLVKHPDEIAWITHCSTSYSPDGSQNVLRVELDEEVEFDLEQLQRHFYTSSSCGVCGKASLEALEQESHFKMMNEFNLSATALKKLPEQLVKFQAGFESTGGIHAAASFDHKGSINVVYEDVGRHNALDKLIGHHALNNQLPMTKHGILVSGRTSFELLQKCMMAGCSCIVAIGAPSTLAIDAAKKFNITLIGFIKSDSYNIYNGADAIYDQ